MLFRTGANPLTDQGLSPIVSFDLGTSSSPQNLVREEFFSSGMPPKPSGPVSIPTDRWYLQRIDTILVSETGFCRCGKEGLRAIAKAGSES